MKAHVMRLGKEKVWFIVKYIKLLGTRRRYKIMDLKLVRKGVTLWV